VVTLESSSDKSEEDENMTFEDGTRTQDVDTVADLLSSVKGSFVGGSNLHLQTILMQSEEKSSTLRRAHSSTGDLMNYQNLDIPHTQSQSGLGLRN